MKRNGADTIWCPPRCAYTMREIYLFSAARSTSRFAEYLRSKICVCGLRSRSDQMILNGYDLCEMPWIWLMTKSCVLTVSTLPQ
jgi:hypothetical protein